MSGSLGDSAGIEGRLGVVSDGLLVGVVGVDDFVVVVDDDFVGVVGDLVGVAVELVGVVE